MPPYPNRILPQLGGMSNRAYSLWPSYSALSGLQALLDPFFPIREQSGMEPRWNGFGFSSPSQVNHGQGVGRMIDAEQNVVAVDAAAHRYR